MARAVENTHIDQFNPDTFSLGNRFHIFFRCCIQIDNIVRIIAAQRNLIHIGIGRI